MMAVGTDAHEFHALLADTTSEAAVQLDGQGKAFNVNPAFLRMFGYREKELLEREIDRVFTERSRDRFNQTMASCLKTGKGETLNLEGLTKKGRQLPVRIAVVPFGHQRDPGAMVFIEDFSEQLELREELEAIKSSYSALSETVTDPILQINESFRIVFANSAVQRVFDYSAADLLGREFSLLFPPSVHNHYEEVFKKYFVIDDVHRQASRLDNTIEVLGQNKSGDIVPLEISFGNSKSVQGERLVTCIIRDISQRKKTERKLKYLAYHDKLTDLGNRDLFYITLEQLLSHVKRYQDMIGAVLFLDLDGFKRVNDTLGHNVGDTLLCSCARRLSGCLRESDYVYRFSTELETTDGSFEDLFRFGGDEFVILLTNLQKPTDAAVVAQKIIDTIKRPFQVQGLDPGTKATIGVSIGIALVPQDGLKAMELIKHADMAMYKAKEKGNRYMFFTPELNRQASERLFLENGIRKALDQRVFDLHYQPIVDVQGAIEGMEALLRWHDPKRGFIDPVDFVPVAEETGLILPLGDWVLETACRQLNNWNSEGFDSLYVSVNLSVKQFGQERVVDKLSTIIGQTGINPRNLKIEISESSIMPNPKEARLKMEELKKRHPGIRIAIDDFGTGYSSLSYLSDFPVDILKIDQSFVINMYKRSTTKIINTILALANGLQMDVIAEGVETRSQLEYLLSRNCRSFQGFYFSKPLSAPALTQLLKSYEPPLRPLPEG